MYPVPFSSNSATLFFVDFSIKAEQKSSKKPEASERELILCNRFLCTWRKERNEAGKIHQPEEINFPEGTIEIHNLQTTEPKGVRSSSGHLKMTACTVQSRLSQKIIVADLSFST